MSIKSYKQHFQQQFSSPCAFFRNFAQCFVRMREHACAMRIIKRLDWYVLRSYLMLFAGTFFVCLFIFMLQFLWRYVDDLVGKGLSWFVLAKFFFYASLTLVPMSLPLAVLLASLISFGNMGEKLELLSMKAAGIPLVRIILPVFLLVLTICLGSFFFQNKVGPEATRQLATLLWSMRQKNPEVEIPEGIFYSDIPGYNIYIEHKDAETGMLYGVMIYTSGGGADNTQIVLADSARMQSTADHMHLKMTLYSGERFRNMDAQSGRMLRASIPYMRETFVREVDLIPFDNNFSMMDANLFNSNAQTKDLSSIQHGIDSLSQRLDSMGHRFYDNALAYYLMRSLPVTSSDSVARLRRMAHLLEVSVPLDTALARQSVEEQQRTLRFASAKAHSTLSEFDFRGVITETDNYALRTHLLEWQRKFSLSLACIIFFFIGAPLGAIIRKGGLGVPVVVSVLIFIFYYIINVAGEKMAKQGEWNMLFGAWLSSMVLAPIGGFLISRANKESMVFNIEGYRHFFMTVLGLRYNRKIARKEVIIHEPDYPRMLDELRALTDHCQRYQERHHLRRFPSYWRLYFHYREDKEVIAISEHLEQIIEELHNSRDNVIIAALGEYPILVPDAHTRPFHSSRLCLLTGLVLPLGIFFWFRVWRFRIRLWRDLTQIQRLSPMIAERIDLHVLSQEISDKL